jgi:hypothetical protein
MTTFKELHLLVVYVDIVEQFDSVDVW